jgi:hypothetical protein
VQVTSLEPTETSRESTLAFCTDYTAAKPEQNCICSHRGTYLFGEATRWMKSKPEGWSLAPVVSFA